MPVSVSANNGNNSSSSMHPNTSLAPCNSYLGSTSQTSAYTMGDVTTTAAAGSVASHTAADKQDDVEGNGSMKCF